MFVVDTNILLYAADEDTPEFAQCNQLIQRWRESTAPWHLTWNVLYEFTRVITHPRVKPKPWTLEGAVSFVETLLGSPSVSILSHGLHHVASLHESGNTVPSARGNLLFDLHTAVLMREHGIRRIYTNDMDFHRFPWVEVVNPLA